MFPGVPFVPLSECNPLSPPLRYKSPPIPAVMLGVPVLAPSPAATMISPPLPTFVSVADDEA